MHIKLFATVMIAALLWAGVPSVTTAPTKQAAGEINTTAAVQTQTPEEIALAHAGLTTDEVKGLRTTIDFENGVREFEVEFRSGDWEYDYTIHGETLEILEHEKEYDPPRVKPVETVPPTTEPTKPAETIPPVTEPEESQFITADEAKSIALAHAGLTADAVTILRAEFDLDDGQPEYEVEFRSGDWEYDYTIHGQTGKILEHDKEYDPPKTKPAETVPQETKPAKAKTITVSEAKSIALAHAGLTAAEVKGLQAEYDWDDGRPEYEVEFRVGNWEYSYEIHGQTGEILDWEKDWDD